MYQVIVMNTIYGPWIMRLPKLTNENSPFWVKVIPNYEGLFKAALNSGPLGLLSWCMMLLFGSVAYDVMASGKDRKIIGWCTGWGLGLCAFGHALSLPWVAFKAAWPISAYYMTLPFPLWATRLCLLHLLFFYLLGDKAGMSISTLTPLGMNSLFLYILLCLITTVFGDGFDLPVPGTLLGGLVGFALFYSAFATLAHYLHRKQIYIKNYR